MNKFFKYGLMIAGVSMAVGILFAFFSTIIGGKIVWRNHSGWVVRSLSHMGFWDDVEDFWDDAEDFWDTSYDRDERFRMNENKNDASTELRINGEPADIGKIQEPGEIPSAGIRNLELDLGAGEFYIREKDTDDGSISILVQGLIGDCDYYTDGDTLHVESFKGNHLIGEDLSKNQIIIDIPKGKQFDEVDLTCGAAMVEADYLKASELEILVGAGEARINYASVDRLSASIGAGRVEANDVLAREVDLEVGMGECVYYGTILKDLDAQCDLGNMEIMVTGSMKDYNYEIECNAGSINLGGNSITSLASEKEIFNGAPGTFELSCNMGNITVDFLG